MNRTLDRRTLLQAGLAAGATLLAGPARACEYYAGNLRITHPWTRATAADDRFAVVCMKIDEVTRTDRLIGVATPVAEGAELGGVHGPQPLVIDIPAGRETLLGDSGPHVRLTGLTVALLPGRSYPLTLRFELAGPVEASLNVDYARFG